MTTAIAWIYLIWQACRVTKKLLGFNKASWDEVFAPTIIIAALLTFGLALTFVLMLFISLIFVII